MNILTKEIENLTEGNSIHTVCPFCNATHERSFRVTHYPDGSISGKCYRVKCGAYHVFVKGSGILAPSETKLPKFTQRYYHRLKELGPVPQPIAIDIYNKHTIRSHELISERVLWDKKTSLMYFPVFDHKGNSFGGMTKDYYKVSDKYPKWVTYFDRQTNKLHYPRSPIPWKITYNQIVIVEDIISAIRVNRYVKACAILGTNLNERQALELSNKANGLIVALDPDAMQKAILIKQKYNSLFTDGVEIKTLVKDPKDYISDSTLINHLGIDSSHEETRGRATT